MNKTFFALLVSVLLISCSSSSRIDVKDWDSEASVREAMQGKWNTSDKPRWERRFEIKGNRVTVWSRNSTYPNWKKRGTFPVEFRKHKTNAMAIYSSDGATEWVFRIDYRDGSWNDLVVRHDGGATFRSEGYDMTRGW